MALWWPDSLPKYPSHDGFQGHFPDGSIRSQVGAGPAKVRRRFSAAVETFTWQKKLSAAQMEALYNFFKEDCAMGSLSFYMNNPWQFGVEILGINRGFEEGSFPPGWTQNNAVIEGSIIHSGSYSAKLVATGTNLWGVKSDPIPVDETETYTGIAWNKVTARTSGRSIITVRYYSDVEGLTEIGNAELGYLDAVTDWTEHEKTLGPTGADLVFPSGTKSLSIGHLAWDSSPNLTAYVDDFSLEGPRVSKCRFAESPTFMRRGSMWLVTAPMEVLP